LKVNGGRFAPSQNEKVSQRAFLDRCTPECVAKARFVAGVVATGILTLGFSASR
jgi:predicted ATPase